MLFFDLDQKKRFPDTVPLQKTFMMENLITIIKGTTARLSFVCAGKVYYHIETENHLYQLEINSMEEEFTTTYLEREYKAITLMRWIRKGLEENTLIQLK